MRVAQGGSRGLYVISIVTSITSTRNGADNPCRHSDFADDIISFVVTKVKISVTVKIDSMRPSNFCCRRLASISTITVGSSAGDSEDKTICYFANALIKPVADV
jgi:hypothetical protein